VRANVLHNDPDSVVREVLGRLTRQSLVDGPLGSAGVQGVVERMFQTPQRPDSFGLDLIAHSRNGVLHIGDWAVESNAPTRSLRDACTAALREMPLREIRLLGCNTAIRPGGRTAMRGLAQLFDARVWGTKAPISANDFDSHEFRSTGLLADHRDIDRFAMPSLRTAGRWFVGLARSLARRLDEITHELRAESEDEALGAWHRAAPASRWPIRKFSRSEIERLLSHVEPGMARVPGILALPDLEIVALVDGQVGGYHRFTILLDHELVRVYPSAIPAGCVFRVRKTPAWLAALHSGEVIRP
jgi:hypothetical protein